MGAKETVQEPVQRLSSGLGHDSWDLLPASCVTVAKGPSSLGVHFSSVDRTDSVCLRRGSEER